MSTIPSLALIPSGVKASKVYSVLPTDGTGDFTFDRNLNTATRVNSQGLIEMVAEDVPRLNYPLIDGVVQGCPSLLLEPERRNLVTYSESFDNAAWIKVSNTSISDNFAISPDGTQNSSEIKATSTSTSVLGFYTGFTVSSGVEYTISFFVKKGIVKYIQLYHAFFQVAGVPRTNFDLENGVVSVSDAGHTSSIEDYGNGWYRCIVKLTTATTILQTFFNAVKLPYAPRDASSSWSANDNFYFYGAQLEQGSYPTSYIPTNGSTVTRSAETCSQTPPSGIIGQTEGTMYVDVDINTLSTDGQVLRLTNGTSGTGRIAIERNPSNQNQIRVTQWGGAILTFSISIGNRYKIAVGYDSSNSNVYVNGSSIGTTFFTNVAELNKVSLGCNEVGGSIFNDTIKESKIYNTRLSNAELQALTS